MGKRDSIQPLIPTPSPLTAPPTGGKGRAPSETGSARRRGRLGLPSMTTKQILYVVVLQCLGAGVIDGAANFGIACAMYRTGTSSIQYWPISKGCLGGDMAVTVFIQGVLTFLISSSLVHADMRKGTITPLSRPWPSPLPSPADPSARPSLRHRLAAFLAYPFAGSRTQDCFDFSVGWRHTLYRVFWSAWQGLTLSAAYFLIVWPIAVAATAPSWGGAEMRGTWVPPVMKLVFGAVYGLVFTPLCALIAMGAEEVVEAHAAKASHSEGVREMEEAAEAAAPVVAAPLPAHIV